jgi:hypothetical protein
VSKEERERGREGGREGGNNNQTEREMIDCQLVDLGKDEGR